MRSGTFLSAPQKYPVAHQCVPVVPQDVREVENVVRDGARFPSPLLTAGCEGELECCRRRGAGTVLMMAGLSRIVGLYAVQGGACQVSCRARPPRGICSRSRKAGPS